MKAMATPEILVRARNAFKMGEYPLVEKLAQRILDEQPESAVAYNLLGSVCEKTGRFRKAIELFQKAVALKPDYTEAHNNLGVIYKRIESYGEAIPHLERAITLSPGRGDVYYNLGNVYKSLNNDALASENFEKAIAVDPTFVPSYINLGTALEAQGRLGDAIRIYQKGLQADSSQPRLHYNLGVVYERLGRLAEAREEYEAAVKARPGWADALNNLGVTIHRMGDHHAAERVLREVLRAEPKNARALNNLGVVLSDLGKPEDATQLYRESLKANPRYLQAVENLSALLEREGKLTEALEELRRLLSLEPGNIDARVRLAGILLSLENYPEALQHFKTVLEARPLHPGALKGIALAWGRTGQKERALECYAQLETLGGTEHDFLLDRAFLLKESGDIEKAQEDVLRHLTAVPDDYRARILLADIYAKLGHVRQAAQTLIEVLEVSPSQKEASSRLAKLYRQLGEPKKAIETMEGLINRLEQSNDPADMDALTRAMEEYEQAIAEHEKDFRDEREMTIRRLRELTVESAPTEAAKPEEDPLMMDDLEPLAEDAVPIINVGGLEPVFAVREEDEELQLEEVEESVQDEEIDIEDERPPNLVNLLKDQELYEENPALALFERPPVLPSQQPRGQAPTPGPPQPPSAMAPQYPPYQPPPLPPPQAPPPSQMPLSPQGESVLANSLKESVAAQSKVVDKLFDEMKELSRKIEERPSPPQQPMPPIVVNMQQPGASAGPRSAPPPLRPIVMDLPSAPQAEGLPRYAAADFEDEEEQAPRGRPIGRSARQASEADVEIEEAPEELEEQQKPKAPAGGKGAPRTLPAATPAQAPEAPSAGSEPPATRMSSDLPPAPVPPHQHAPWAPSAPEELDAEGPPPEPELHGFPGLGPITDSEPEPEIEGNKEEVPEAELEPVDDVPPPGPRPTAKATAGIPGADTPETEEERSSDDVRKELRDYLNGVRDKLGSGQDPASRDEPASPAPRAAPAARQKPADPRDLLDYLGKLSDYLPEREKKRFRGSNERLAMESLKAQLAGKKGLRRKVTDSFPAVAPRRKAPMTRSLVVDTFAYLKDMAAFHPDAAVGAAMKEKIESIVARMGRGGSAGDRGGSR